MTVTRWARHESGHVGQMDLRDENTPFPPGWEAWTPPAVMHVTAVAETATVEAPKRRGRPPGSKNRQKD